MDFIVSYFHLCEMYKKIRIMICVLSHKSTLKEISYLRTCKITPDAVMLESKLYASILSTNQSFIQSTL